MFFLYGESLIYYFKHIVFVDEYFLYFAIHHRFISAVLYLMGNLDNPAACSAYFGV
jgi:phosphatidate cytidylyltransferase